MIELIEVVRGRLIGPKTWDRIVGNFWRPFEQFSDSPRTVWAIGVGICVINCIVVCMRPEIVIKFGFTKWNRYWEIGREQ